MPHVSIRCPHCGTSNDITVSEVPEPIEIFCSRCHAPLGRWSELEQKSKAPRTVNGKQVRPE